MPQSLWQLEARPSPTLRLVSSRQLDHKLPNQGRRWVRDITGALTIQVILDYYSSGTRSTQFPWTPTPKTGRCGDGRLIISSLQPPLTPPSSWDKRASQAPKCLAKHALRRSASSLFGWPFMIVAGRQHDAKDITFGRTTHVSYVERNLKRSLIYWSDALSAGKSGTPCCEQFTPHCSLHNRMNSPWRTGGQELGGKFTKILRRPLIQW